MKRKIALLIILYAIVGLLLGASASIEQQIESLINQLSDEDGVVRRNATLNLVRLGKPAVPELAGALPQADYQLSFRIVDTLRQMDSDAQEAVPVLITALREPDFFNYSYPVWGDNFHREVAHTLIAIGSPAVPALVEALSDVNKDTRYYAAFALEWMGSKAQAAVPALMQLLDDEEDEVRKVAASALGTMGTPDPGIIVTPLTPLTPWDLENQHREPALGQVDHPAQAAVPTLIQMLGDENESDAVRVAAAGALGSIGDVTAGPVLIAVLLGDEDESDSIRVAAAGALGSIGDVTASLALIGALKDRYDRIRSEAAWALGKIGKPAEVAVPTLINMLQTEVYDQVRSYVVHGLAGIATPDALNALIEAIFNDESSLVRKEAVLGLGRIGEPVDEIVPPLLKVLADSDPDVRLAVSVALAKIGEPAIPVLIVALSHKSLELRRGTALALSLMGAAAQAAEPRLIEALKDGDKDVRRYAARALKKIGTPEAIKAAEPVLEKDDKPVTVKVPVIVNVRKKAAEASKAVEELENQ